MGVITRLFGGFLVFFTVFVVFFVVNLVLVVCCFYFDFRCFIVKVLIRFVVWFFGPFKYVSEVLFLFGLFVVMNVNDHLK